MSLSVYKNEVPSFIIDSKFRIDGDTNNFTHKVELHNFNDFTNVACVQAVVPKSYYTIPANRNFFLLTEDGLTAQVNLTPANYNVEQFRLELEYQLNTSSPQGWTYTVSFPGPSEPQTNKYTFDVSGNGGLQPTFTMQEVNREVVRCMGFGVANFDQLDYDFIADQLTSINVINFNSNKYITIRSNICNNFGNADSDNSVLLNMDTANVPYGSVITYRMPDLNDGIRALTHSKANVFKFSIYDGEGNLLDLNGQEWKMTLYVWKHNPYYELAIEQIETQGLSKKERELKLKEEEQKVG